MDGLQSAFGDSPQPRLEGAWLRAARLLWIVLSVAAVGILVFSLPGYLGGFTLVPEAEAAGASSIGVLFFSAANSLASLASALLSLSLAWMLFWRRFAEPAAAALSFFLLSYGIVMAGPLEVWARVWIGPNNYSVYLQTILSATPIVALLLLFPNGRFVPRWTRWVLLSTLPWNLFLFFVPSFGALNFEDHPLLAIFLAAWYIGFIILSLYAQIYRFRHVSTPAERQQMKWVIYGFGLWFLVILLTSGPYFYLIQLPPGVPTPWWQPASTLVWFLGLNILPVSFTIAIMRYRLWNIDLVINRTLLYSALTGALVVIYFLSVTLLQQVLPAQSKIATVLSTLAIAAVFNPLRWRIQRDIDRLFYRSKYDAERTLAVFAARIRDEMDLEMLSAEFLSVVDETMQSAETTLWLKLPADH
jgi:hypothetical protein